MSSDEDLVAINANDGQIAQLELLVRTLRDPDRGHFRGRACVITTGISSTSRDILARYNVEVFESDLEEFESWWYAPVVGCYEFLKALKDFRRRSDRFFRRADRFPLMMAHLARTVRWFEERLLTRQALALGLDGDQSGVGRETFRRYMLKHFSKFSLLKYLATGGRSAARVMLLDSDIIFQRPIAEIFNRVSPGVCLVEYEKEPMVGDYFVARSNRLARRFPQARCLRFGADVHEVNVGFICSDAKAIRDVLQDWKELMLHGGLEKLFVAHSTDGWHEQDFFRLLSDMQPTRFAAAGKNLVYHAVHAAADDLVHDGAGIGRFRHKESSVIPVLVHFAGGFWTRFPRVREAYRRSLSSLLSGASAKARVVIYGAGTDCTRYFENPEPAETVVGVVDTDRARYGRHVGGREIIGPERLQELPYDFIRITSSATFEIYSELRQLGVPDDRIVSPLLESENRRRLEHLATRHNGQPAVIVGCGRGLHPQDVAKLSEFRGVTIGCNQIFRTFHHVDFRPSYLLLDHAGLAARYAQLLGGVISVTKLVPETLLRQIRADDNTIVFGLGGRIAEGRGQAWSNNLFHLFKTGSVVGTALQLLLCMGCSRIYLLGFDAVAPLPWIERKPDANCRGWPVDWKQPKEVSAAASALVALNRHARAQDTEIFNVGGRSSLEMFSYRTFNELLSET